LRYLLGRLAASTSSPRRLVPAIQPAIAEVGDFVTKTIEKEELGRSPQDTVAIARRGGSRPDFSFRFDILCPVWSIVRGDCTDFNRRTASVQRGLDAGLAVSAGQVIEILEKPSAHDASFG